MALGILWAAAMLPSPVTGQTPAPAPPPAQTPAPPNNPRARLGLRDAPVTNVSVDGSEAMFATMCALLAAGFEADVSSENWTPMRAQLRDRMQHQQGPAVDAVREFYKKHELADAGAMLSQYIWFGLVSGPAPKFTPTLRRDELPPEVIALEGFSEILSAYYVEQHIGRLWVQVQPVYNHEIDEIHDAVSQIVFVATNYLRQLSNPGDPRTFTIIVEPLVGRITNVRNFQDHYAIVLSGSADVPVDVVRHAFLHFLLDPLPLQYPHVIAVKRPLYDVATRAPRLTPDLRPSRSFGTSPSAVALRRTAPWWKPRTRNTGRAVNGLPCSFATRYVVNAISQTSHSTERTIRRNAWMSTGTSSNRRSTCRGLLVPSFRAWVLPWVRVTAVSVRSPITEEPNGRTCAGGGAVGAVKAEHNGLRVTE